MNIEEIVRLSNLEELFLYSNRITQIPDCLTSLTKLHKLILIQNNFAITKLPGTNLFQIFLSGIVCFCVMHWFVSIDEYRLFGKNDEFGLFDTFTKSIHWVSKRFQKHDSIANSTFWRCGSHNVSTWCGPLDESHIYWHVE